MKIKKEIFKAGFLACLFLLSLLSSAADVRIKKNEEGGYTLFLDGKKYWKQTIKIL